MGNERVVESWSLAGRGAGEQPFDVVVSRLDGDRWRVRQSSAGCTVREDEFDDERSCRVLLRVLEAMGEQMGGWQVTRREERTVIGG